MAKPRKNKETTPMSESETSAEQVAQTEATTETETSTVASNGESKQVTIAGIPFQVPQPFESGHTCTENEAAALNQLIIENLRNNFAQQIGKMKAEAEAGKAAMPSNDELQAKFSEYAASYQFGVRRASTGAPKSADPVERELNSIAMKMVKDALKAKGYKLKEFTDEQVEEIAGQLIANRPDLRGVAERRVAEMKGLDTAGLDLPTVAPKAEEPAAAPAATE